MENKKIYDALCSEIEESRFKKCLEIGTAQRGKGFFLRFDAMSNWSELVIALWKGDSEKAKTFLSDKQPELEEDVRIQTNWVVLLIPFFFSRSATLHFACIRIWYQSGKSAIPFANSRLRTRKKHWKFEQVAQFQQNPEYIEFDNSSFRLHGFVDSKKSSYVSFFNWPAFLTQLISGASTTLF